jgi:PhzF family phenazine biosynthesis protein
METTIYQVDSFTNRPFHGNPAGVCLIESPRPDEWMQSIAMEMNLSETAFPLRERDGYRLRWFTPKVEVDLCGHATLATAHILWESGEEAPETVLRFYTRSGLLTAKLNESWIDLNFPVAPVQPAPIPQDLIEALGVTPRFVGKDGGDYLVEVENESMLIALEPDFVRLKKVAARGIIVTCRSSSSDYDFVSRFFAPRVGINEDPVTGSAHCALAPYWRTKLEKDSMHAFQASPRGGELRVRLDGERVIISGQAVTVISGSIFS